MRMSTTDLVEKLKGAALKAGTEGLRLMVDGTVTAVKMMDRLQELLPDRERPIPASPVKARPARSRRAVKAPSAEAKATAERVLAEVEAVQERLKEARPARRPLKVRSDVEVQEGAPKRRGTARTSGRKTSPLGASSPKRATAKGTTVKGITVEEGFKAKRGQKLRH